MSRQPPRIGADRAGELAEISRSLEERGATLCPAKFVGEVRGAVPQAQERTARHNAAESSRLGLAQNAETRGNASVLVKRLVIFAAPVCSRNGVGRGFASRAAGRAPPKKRGVMWVLLVRPLVRQIAVRQKVCLARQSAWSIGPTAISASIATSATSRTFGTAGRNLHPPYRIEALLRVGLRAGSFRRSVGGHPLDGPREPAGPLELGDLLGHLAP
jgi:hypothetical protein